MVVARPELRALFHSNDEDLAAEDVFADRIPEWEVVRRSLLAHAESLRSPGFSVADFTRPRRNVVVFYGVGGIGKSTLSRQLERHLADGEGGGTPQWSEVPGGLGRLLPVRVDFARQAGTDFETVVLAIRLAIASLGPPMLAFDLAFRRYWEANHPGLPLAEYLRTSGPLARFTAAMALPDQMQSVLADVAQSLLLPGTVGGLVGQGLSSLVGALRERRHSQQALAGCARLADLLEADPNQETLSYYAHLLAWDLAQLPAERALVPVVLFDTFEEVGDRTHRDLERLLQRLVWLMPNALFVITGRDRLQWGDTRYEGQLDWVGPGAWPLLTSGAVEDPRQHRVGYLSARDCDQYLSRRLTRRAEPLMPADTRRMITARSHGLPLYLDLAVMRFLDLFQATGRRPRPEEFNYDFPALVARTFRDLSPEEARVVRAVSLFDSFSIDLATAAAGLMQDAAALRVVERPFIESAPDSPWPYHLHELVREAVRDADDACDDRWSEADWQRAAQRALVALGRELPDTSGPQQRQRLVACLRQGLRLVRDFGLEPDWLIEAAFRYVADSMWEPIDIPGGVDRPGGTADDDGPVTDPATALAEAVTVIARRQRTHRQVTADRLVRVLATEQMPHEARELAVYYLAECHRDLGRPEDSRALMRQVVDIGGRMASTAARGLIHLDRRLGNFPQVLAAAEALQEPRGRRQRVLGDLWWPQGRMSLSCAAYAAAREEAMEEGARGQAALAQACLAFAAGFQDRQRAAEQLNRAEEMLQGVQLRWAKLQKDIARLVVTAGSSPNFAQEAESLVQEAAAAGLTSPAAYTRLAECFHYAVAGEEYLLDAARQRLAACVQGAEFAYLLEITYFMTGAQPPSGLPRAEWIEGVEQAAALWRSVVTDRQRELSSIER
ncbi:ATP/GTP-binding protein [Streptomyces sp. NPDC002738]